MIFYFIKHHVHKINFIFPIYFLVLYIYIFIQIYLMCGNRDFLLGKKFCKASGCKLLKDPTVINLYNHKVLLTHGDLLCTNHTAYLKFRKKMHNLIRQKLFLLLPLRKRLAIAEHYRDYSQQFNQQAVDNLLTIPQVAVENMMLKHNVEYLIHGHIHQAGIHKFKYDGSTMTRAVLGSWENNSNVLICAPDKQHHSLTMELKDFA